jgi:hypothetical protein
MSSPLGLDQVLDDEFQALRGRPAPGVDASADAATRLKQVRAAIHADPDPYTALCFSGGGIRSGTFALGVMQALAHLGVLGRFDYLSSVSGGGYTSGWLTAWLHRVGPEHRDTVFRAIDPASRGDEPGGIEAPPVEYVRRTCRYLAPTGGPASADFWTVLATMARNLLLNWMVILPLVAAALLIPRLFFGLSESLFLIGQGFGSDAVVAPLHGLSCFTQTTPPIVLGAISLAGFSIAIGYMALVFAGIGASWSQGRFLQWCLVPLMVGASGAALFWDAYPCGLSLGWMIGLSAGLPTLGWLTLGLVPRWFARMRATVPGSSRLGWRVLLASLVSGPILGVTLYWFAMGPFGVGPDAVTDQLYTLLAVPVVLLAILVTIAVFVGLASRDLTDPALEWWSRCSAWIGISMALWLTSSAIVLYLAEWLGLGIHAVTETLGVSHAWATPVMTTLLPLLSSLAGLAARSGRANRTATGKPSAARILTQAVALPCVLVVLLTGIGWLNLRGVEALEYHTYDAQGRVEPCPTSRNTLLEVPVAGGTRDACHEVGGGLGETVVYGALCIVFGLGMSLFVPVNRFSLHGMYRQRLIRTFLGASRPDRTPSPFTGFDGNDDLRVHDLANVRPLHVLNTTLNAVASTSVGRHEQQSESFVFTPLHVGNTEVGFRRSAEYGSDGGARSTGLSLGMAMAVSGAAAASSMGIYSSKPRSFLLTLANARLGVWFGNPRDAESWKGSDPPLGVGPVIRELLGLTTDSNPYVYLSDGGHYENLGLWEMVSRRCRFIVIADAGCDPEYGFGDLSNAVRRIRLDLGISIEFPAPPMTKAGQGHGNPHGMMGVIRYSDVDGPDAPDGTVLYLKATLSGDESIDVLNFAQSDEGFPHDPTSDQFFDEARFESYRALGFHTVMSVAGTCPVGTGVPELCRAAATGLHGEMRQ